MQGFEDIQSDIKKGKLRNCYIFCGMDEQLIKESIKTICDKTVNNDFIDLNYSRFDGSNVNFDTIYNACETLPFMNDKKVVVVFRANFLSDNKGKDGEDEVYKGISKYIETIPDHCILIMYYVYQGDREKLSSKVKKLQKMACIGEFNKLKGTLLEKKVKLLFDERGKDIDKTELSMFCSMVENNMEIVINEVNKLCAYTEGRSIKISDIKMIMPPKSDNDIFDLVDFISQKKAERALDILNELLFRGEKTTSILAMIERQFKLLFSIKLGIESGKGKESLSQELRLHPYICEKMILQSRKFSLNGLQDSLMMCLDTERRLKSSSVDDKTEMELLIVNTLRI